MLVLKATEVGARKGAKERKAEWKRKNDPVGKDLLGQTQKGKIQKLQFSNTAAS